MVLWYWLFGFMVIFGLMVFIYSAFRFWPQIYLLLMKRRKERKKWKYGRELFLNKLMKNKMNTYHHSLGMFLLVVYFNQPLWAVHYKLCLKSYFQCFFHVFSQFWCKNDKRWFKKSIFSHILKHWSTQKHWSLAPLKNN